MVHSLPGFLCLTVLFCLQISGHVWKLAAAQDVAEHTRDLPLDRLKDSSVDLSPQLLSESQPLRQPNDSSSTSSPTIQPVASHPETPSQNSSEFSATIVESEGIIASDIEPETQFSAPRSLSRGAPGEAPRTTTPPPTRPPSNMPGRPAPGAQPEGSRPDQSHGTQARPVVDHSGNVSKPPEAERCPTGCIRWHDGCNSCICSADGYVGACLTNKDCDFLDTPRCLLWADELKGEADAIIDFLFGEGDTLAGVTPSGTTTAFRTTSMTTLVTLSVAFLLAFTI